MKYPSNVVSIHPYFKVHPGKLDAFKDEIHRLLRDDPKLPGVRVRELLTPPACAACQRPHDVNWSGPISMFEQELVALDKQIAEAQLWIDAHLSSARALLLDDEKAATVGR